MGLTIVERAIKEIVDREMESEDFASVMNDYLCKLNENWFGWHQDVIHQKWHRLRNDVYDAYAFGSVHELLCNGSIAVAEIDIGFIPSRDSDTDGNNRKLSTLRGPFSGSFHGGTQDEDGYIFVAGDIDFSIVAIRGDTNQSLAVGGLFPLEVGYTSSIKTMMYLCPTMGRLARWPYGSSSIYLLYRVA